MLPKLLQIIGVIFSIAGLLGEERIRRWERYIQNKISRLLDIKGFLGREQDFYSKIRSEYSESKKEFHQLQLELPEAHLISFWFLKVSAFIFWCYILFTNLINKLELPTSPNSDSFNFVFWGFSIAIYLLPLVKSYFTGFKDQEYKELASRNQLGRIFASLLAALPLAFLSYIAFFVFFITPLLVMFLIGLSGIEIIFRAFFLMTLIPYIALDSFAKKIKIRSTILLTGLIIELIGIILQ